MWWFSSTVEDSLEHLAEITGEKDQKDTVAVTLASISGSLPPTDVASSIPVSTTATAGFAFCFDIDGVLVRSDDVLPYASKTLQHLIKHNVPFVFLTNSGGKSEQARVCDLEKKFDVNLSTDQFVQSHTPFQDLVPTYKTEPVLVLGGVGNSCRDVALGYGFKNVITSADIIAAEPRVWPFNQLAPCYYKSLAKPLPKDIKSHDPANSLRVSAILVFNSPRDWGLDCQIALDLLLSDNGVLGTYSPLNGDPSLPNHGYQQQAGSCKIFFANPDFVWKTNYEYGNRFGQGAFLIALKAIFHEATNCKAVLQHTLIGKPSKPAYVYAENVLIKKRALMIGSSKLIPLRRVLMIGDNPLSDVLGANQHHDDNVHGTIWESALVETGVHNAGEVPRVKPTVVVPDVRDAVNWLLKQEGFPLID